MNCPHCSKSISLFSPAIFGPTKPGGARLCPHCEGKFAITGDPKIAVVVAIGVAVVGFFVLRPIPVVGGPLWGFVTVFATFVAAARLKMADA